jgi:hypothetical protein
VVYYYIKQYVNLGFISSQRGESYYLIIKKITNRQLSFKESGKRLASTVLSILKDLTIYEYASLRSYNRRV